MPERVQKIHPEQSPLSCDPSALPDDGKGRYCTLNKAGQVQEKGSNVELSQKHCEGFFRAELLVNLRRVACAESPAWRYQHGDTRAELLAQSSLRRVTSMEILAQSHQHGDTSMEILAQSHQHGDTCAESPAWSHQHRVTCAEPSAKSQARRAKCSEQSAKSEVQGAKCTELSAQSQVQRAKCIEPGA